MPTPDEIVRAQRRPGSLLDPSREAPSSPLPKHEQDRLRKMSPQERLAERWFKLHPADYGLGDSRPPLAAGEPGPTEVERVIAQIERDSGGRIRISRDSSGWVKTRILDDGSELRELIPARHRDAPLAEVAAR